MDESFHVDVTRSRGVARLSLVGELDAAGASVLAECLDAVTRETGEAVDPGASPRVVIDLTRLTFIDSGGLAVIRSAEERSVEVLSAHHPCRGVRRVFEVTGLDRLIEGS